MLSSDPKTELLNDLFDGFRGIRELWNGLIAQYGLSVSHYMALKHLHRRGARSMSQLTETLHITHGACTSVIDRLASVELVARQQSPLDRRVVQVQLTQRGEAVLAAIHDESIKRLTTVFGDLSTDDRLQLAQGLKVLANAFRSTHASPDGDHPHAKSC